jgi:protein-disulfide isomerase
MSRKAVIALVVIALIAAAGIAWHVMNKSGASVEGAMAAVTNGQYGITARDMTQGSPTAKVVVIEYAAPICPHCAHFNATVMPLLKKNYIDTGKVLYVLRVFPLAAADGVAEKLGRCLPRAKYFPFMDQLFANQSKWDPEFGITDVRGGLLEQAKLQGMSEDKFNACLADTKEDAAINKVAADGQAKYNIDHTPTIIVNGTVQDGAAEWDKLKAILDMALAGK